MCISISSHTTSQGTCISWIICDPGIHFLTGVKVLSYHGDSCVVDVAPSNRPYIDRVHNQLGVAIACNGYAAKSSDEIGRLAVELLIRGQWDIDIPQNLFHVQLKSGCGNPTSRLWSTLKDCWWFYYIHMYKTFETTVFFIRTQLFEHSFLVELEFLYIFKQLFKHSFPVELEFFYAFSDVIQGSEKNQSIYQNLWIKIECKALHIFIFSFYLPMC